MRAGEGSCVWEGLVVGLYWLLCNMILPKNMKD